MDNCNQFGIKRLGLLHVPSLPFSSDKDQANLDLPVWVGTVLERWRPHRCNTNVAGAIEGNNDHVRNYGSLAVGTASNSTLNCDSACDEITKSAQLTGTVCKQINNIVRDIVKDQRTPVVLSAGRIPVLGSISGHAMARLELGVLSVEDASSVCLIVLDQYANMDARIPGFSEYKTRFPTAFILQETFSGIPRHFPGFEWIRPWLSVKRIAFVGLRNPSAEEITFYQENGIHYCTSDDLASRGAQEIINAAIKSVNPRGDLPVHLVINVNALELECKGSDHAVLFGTRKIFVQEVLNVLQAVMKSGTLGALDILEVERIPVNCAERAAEVIDLILHIVSGTTSADRL